MFKEPDLLRATVSLSQTSQTVVYTVSIDVLTVLTMPLVGFVVLTAIITHFTRRSEFAHGHTFMTLQLTQRIQH
jgi:hypothetical protein